MAVGRGGERAGAIFGPTPSGGQLVEKCLHEEVLMTPAEQFRKHAVECGHMANFLHDRQNTVAWNTIAERWLKLADWYESRVAGSNQARQSPQEVTVPADDPGSLDG